MGISFTPQQQRVIDIREHSVLVSAAAGSGKTAVLVERIISMISDENNPADIDRLLVVTFTSAAASEMRERISQAIDKKLEENPENGHLQKQATLLHNAQITTIDSFCLFVIRNNFNDIGLDPGFRVADEGECRLLKKDTMAEIMEEYFAEENSDFFRCVESFSEKGSEKPLADIIFDLYEFSMSFPYPEQFLETTGMSYGVTNEELEETDWMQSILSYCTNILTDATKQILQGESVCMEPDGPYMYSQVLETDMTLLQSLQQEMEKGAEAFGRALWAVSFARLPSKKDESVSIEKRELVKQIRQSVKDMLGKMREEYFFKPLSDMLEDLHKAAPMVEMITKITLRFMERFREKKREKNLIDFHDMEHLALQILVKKDSEGYGASQTALDYRKYFSEIMIDEYQDSNLVQEELLTVISGESEQKYNRFMVGDVKQSIYKFRLARPELFMEKYDTFSTAEGSCIRIDLHKNFRSRQEIIDSVNIVFKKIMGRKLGNIEYNDEAALNKGAAYQQGNCDYRTELLIFEGEENTKEAEARMIAAKIHEMTSSLQVTDAETGELRYVSYKDIVILLRSNSGWDDVFLRVLTQAGIPVYAASKTGYFQTTEIQTLLNLLKIIDNPLQDIPLYGVMISAFGGFSQEEVAQLKSDAAKRHERLFYAVCASEGTKSQRFLAFLNTYREQTSYLPIKKLIQNILMDTNYLYLMEAMPGGEQRRANIEMLLSKAADFEKTSFFGLFHFIRYMEQIEKYDVDYGEASILDENADTVRIMSIHKSKGLEFPVCFVAGLSKRFNKRDAAKALLMDADMGIGAEYVDCEKRLKQTTLKKNAVSTKLKMDSVGEELRVLYVAMSRAKEKMILTAAVKDVEKVKAEAARYSGKNKKMSFFKLMQAGSFLDILFPAVWEEDTFLICYYKEEDLVQQEGAGMIQAGSLAYRLEQPQFRQNSSLLAQLQAQLEERFSFVYAHENLSRLVTKTTVSELKKAGMEELPEEGHVLFEEQQMIPYIPRFMEAKGEENTEESTATGGAARGSAFHKVMELLDFSIFAELEKEKEKRMELERQLNQMLQKGKLTEEALKQVSIAKILTFLKSKLAVRMSLAARQGKLHKEQPFVLGIRADRLEAEFPEEEMVLIQGIVDVFFEEDEKLVVADYKTDAVKTTEELEKKYQIQLDYYEEALEQITGKKVMEKILYSFCLGLEIRLK